MGILRSKARGIEYEYGINTYPPAQDSFGRTLIVDAAMDGMVKQGYVLKVDWSVNDEVGNLAYERGLVNLWLLEEGPYEFALNGSRIYDDAEHYEVSTPVYRTPLDAVIYDKVSEVYAYFGTQAARQKHGKVLTYKNNISTLKSASGMFESVAWGTHYNICLSREVCNVDIWNSVERALIPYMVTRILVMGGGEFVACKGGMFKFDPPHSSRLVGEDACFVISPRAAFIKQFSTFDTTLERGILNLRDEPHSNPSKYWRLHDINHEAARNEFHIYVRDCMQTLFLTAFERGYFTDAPEIANPIAAFKSLASDVNEMKWKIELKDGRNVDAVDDILIGYYLAKVEEMISKSSDADDEDKRAFSLIKAVLNKLSTRSIEYLVDGLDWVTKKVMIEEYGGDIVESITLCNEFSLIDEAVLYYIGESVDFDAVDSRFDPRDSLDFVKTAIPYVDWDKLATWVKEGLTKSPSDTREYLRTNVVKKFTDKVTAVSWAKVYLEGKPLEMMEPLAYTEKEVKDLLERAEKPSDILEKLVRR
ncbi:MAG: hypothetical protein DRJ33_03370 [Candidatus Methanomethylicota archaeon]|uniref:Uncharacterized protein n=3 Tax=Thermoproteota archaeon TaxID=2056631 RepID=A0A497EZY2_9CREN|nr:MAG: hypothetical protein DRJ33_03370 [Candidatus Verstraetearchaeota archaeon]